MNRRAGREGLEQRVLERWRRLPDGSSLDIVVGFSGGADSLALAGILRQLSPLAGFRPILAHVDHGWRSGSAAEQQRAAEMARSLGLPFKGCRVPEASLAGHSGVGREEAARRERYRILAEMAQSIGTDLVALAHHQEDQAETVLLHLLRGAGLQGAAGMREVAEIRVPWWTLGPSQPLRLWRPLLGEPQAMVREYAAAMSLAPIIDPSNKDPSYRRNAVRHRALPVLEQIMPGATAALARFGRLAADDEAALKALADAVLAGACSVAGELRRDAVLPQSTAVRRRVVRRWVEHERGLVMTAERTDAMLALLEHGEPGRRLEIGEGSSVNVTRTGLQLQATGPVGDAAVEGGGDSDAA